MKEGVVVPDVVFHTRVRDESIGGDNPFRWEQKSTADLFAGKRVVVFSLPGAFTPTCSTMQVPGFEAMYDDMTQHVDEVYCVSVNDAFVMNKWGIDQGIKNLKLIPDGSGEFTRQMGMLVKKDNLGFGLRSWRYAMVVDNGIVEKWFEEPSRQDNAEDDPYGVTAPNNLYLYLSTRGK